MNIPAPLIALLCSAACFVASAQEPAPADAAAQPEHKIDFTPNPRYTVFDGPLREDGSIDYIAALNDHERDGVDPADNAARDLLMLFADHEGAGDAMRLVIDALGITEQELADSPRYVDWDDYCESQGIDKTRADDIMDRHAYGPFDVEDGIIIAEWLASNEQAFQVALTSLDKDQFYVPLVTSDIDYAMVLAALMPHLGNHRMLSRGMLTKIDMLAAQGDGETPTKYIRALLRLGYFHSQESSVIQRLVGYSIELRAIEALHRMVTHRRADAEILQQIAQEWDSVPPYGDIATAVGLAERCMSLDSFMQLAFGRLEGKDGDALYALVRAGRVDINTALQTISRQYVSLQRAMHAPTYVDYLRVAEMVETNFHRDAEQAGELTAIKVGELKLPKLDLDPESAGRVMGYQWLGTWYDSYDSAKQSEFAARARRLVARTGLACERFRLANGSYPNTLRELVPQFLSESPIDPMDGQPLRYRVDETGATIYSIYIDLEDDGGDTDITDWNMLQEGDYTWRLEWPAEE